MAAFLKSEPPWDRTMGVFVLRTAHFLECFRQRKELFLSLPPPPPEIAREIETSLRGCRRRIELHYNAAVPENAPLFSAPDFALLIDGRKEITGIPEIPGLTDFHVHTPLAYCSENMGIAEAIGIEALSGIRHVNFSEHSGHLYFAEKEYWESRFRWKTRTSADDRSGEYLKLIRSSAMLPCSFGLELDVDEEGNVIDLPGLHGFRVGAVHFLRKESSYEEKKREYLFRLDSLLASGIDILAHPFRVFARSNLAVPEDLFGPVSDRLAASGTAAEINFHVNFPHAEFVEMVLKKGGKISFGTDSHNLYEAGFLRPHYEFCRSLGIEGQLDRILLSAADRH